MVKGGGSEERSSDEMGEMVPATLIGVALAGVGAGVCQTAVASPMAATVVTITTAPGDGRDRRQTAVMAATVIATTEGEGLGAPFEAHKEPRHQTLPEWIVMQIEP